MSANCCQQLTNLTFASAAYGATSALTAVLFTSINPVAGAIVGVTSVLSGRAINWICEKTNCCPNNACAQLAKMVINVTTGIILGTILAQAAGYSVTLGSVAILTLLTIPVMVGGSICIMGAIAAVLIATGAIASAAGLFNTETQQVSDRVPGSQAINQFVQGLRDRLRAERRLET